MKHLCFLLMVVVLMLVMRIWLILIVDVNDSGWRTCDSWYVFVIVGSAANYNDGGDCH